MAVSSPIDWPTVRKAIHDWFSGSTGLTSIWEDQEAPRPEFPYGSMKVISGPTKLFGADEHRYTYDGNQHAGEEIGIEVAGLRQMTVTVQAFLPRLGAAGDAGAEDYLSRAQVALGMPSYLASLQAAGLSVIEEMAPRNLSGIDSGTWIAKAAMDIRFGLAASVTERTGYVETVGLEPTYLSPNGDVLEYISREFDIEAAGEEMRTLLDTTVTFTSAMAQWGAAGPRFDKMYLTTAGGLVQSAQPTVPTGTTFQVNQNGPESIIVSLQTVGGAIELTNDLAFSLSLFTEVAGATDDDGDMAHSGSIFPGIRRFARPASEQGGVEAKYYDLTKSYPGLVWPYSVGDHGHTFDGVNVWRNAPPLPYMRFGFNVDTTLPTEPLDWVDWHVRVLVVGIPMTYKR